VLLKVQGKDYSGNSFSSRFEARSEADLRAWFTENGITASKISAYFFTSGPYIKFPWLILTWPVFAYAFCQIGYFALKTLHGALFPLLYAVGVEGVDYLFYESPRLFSYFLMLSACEMIIGLLIYNIVIRTGAHYDFDDGRVIQITRNDCVITNKEDLEENE
jgi:hypothetical protein